MDAAYLSELFGVAGKTIVVTGGGGVLCGTLSRALARLGARIAVLDVNLEAAGRVVADIEAEGGVAVSVACDVLQRAAVEEAQERVAQALGPVDALINGAGGNRREATTSPELPFFDLPADAVKWVFDLNFTGVLLPSQVFGREMAGQGHGSVVNIASMNAFRPLTRIPAYSAAKAAVANFTQWLAVHLAQEYTPAIRVNAIAPGFFLTEQNRFLLTTDDQGRLTPRGRAIIDHTPAARFGTPDDLVATVVWLLGEGARFVTGVVVPIDGGFSAYSGV
ncbi:MAG: SDR family oxidoreductase [Anaerolineae bacterium]